MDLQEATELPNSTPVLAGRRREWAALWTQFRTAAEGHCRVTLVAGEPGIGKTRLLREVAALAASHGAAVLWGGARDAEGMPPYLPFLEALGAYISTAESATLRDQAGPVAGTLVPIFPALASRLGVPTAGYALRRQGR